MMTYNQKKIFLQGYRHALNDIRSAERELAEWETIATNITQKISPVIVSTNDNNSKIEMCAIKCLEIREKIALEMSTAIQLRDEVMKAIDKVSDSRKRELLKLKYINGLSVVKISIILDKDEDNIYKMLRTAIKQMDI